ncbi:hypothetical protein NEM98_23180 [Escherichia coli]|nr:hypothetical protein [Escherichia coli]
MGKKYELLKDQTVFFDGVTLYRIRALRDIPLSDVKAGDLGGWVEGEHNLSQDGGAWITDDAWVFGNAVVCDDAQVFDNARVYDEAIISNNARVYDDAKVYERASVCGHTQVYGDISICGNGAIGLT